MTKIDSTPPLLTQPTSSHFDHSAANRLIVLYPFGAGDHPSQVRRIWEIARSSDLNVLILSVCNDFYEESQLRRQLIMLAAMIRDGHICVDIRVGHGNDWIRHLDSVYRPGDVIACYAGQRVGLLQKPLHEVVGLQWDATIYILSEDQPIKNPKPKLLSQVAFWSGALAIIGGFLWLEVRIVQLPQDWAHNLILYVCLFIEVGILMLWNSMFT